MYIYPHDAIDSFGEGSKIDKSMRTEIQLLTTDIELLIWTRSETPGTKTFYCIKLAPGTQDAQATIYSEVCQNTHSHHF